MGMLNAIFTILILVAFIGIVLWAYSGKRKKDFDEAARLPFTGDHTHPEGEGDQNKDSKDHGERR